MQGHVDFSYEVSRSLEACQGCLLLVDATRGVQAQTMSNFYLAYAADLTIIPVINKVDVDTADVPRVTRQMEASLGMDLAGCLLASGKTGLGVPELLPEIIRRIPPCARAFRCDSPWLTPMRHRPSGRREGPPRVRVFDSWFDTYRGSVCLVSVVDGALRTGDRITSHYSGRQYEVAEVGLMYPEQTPVPALCVRSRARLAHRAHVADSA
jgi:translation elongation factor EF-4